MKIVYQKAVLLGTKKEYEPIVEIDLESIICPKPISRIDYPYGCSGSCRTNGNLVEKGIWLDGAFDHVIVRDNMGDLVLLRLKKDEEVK